MNEKSPTEGKPLLDVHSFQQLLEAAYVRQKHNEQSQSANQGATSETPAAETQTANSKDPIPEEESTTNAAKSNYTQTLAEIVSLQHEIQMSRLDLQAAMNLIADRTRRITHADGVSIGLLEDDTLVYQAACGGAAKLIGNRVKADSCLSAQCLSTAAVVQCPDVANDPRLKAEVQNSARALVAVPIFYEGSVVGSLELHFAKPNRLKEHDVRTCQLMAGLVTEAKARSSEREWKQALATERATMLEALEKLKPQLQRLAGSAEHLPETINRASKKSTCKECGSLVDAEQLFCGVCGAEHTERNGADLQSKWASMWNLSQAPAGKLEKEEVAEKPQQDPISSSLQPVSEFADFVSSDHEVQSPVPAADSNEAHPSDQLRITVAGSTDEQVQETTESPSAPVPQKSSPWASAIKAKTWLESLQRAKSASAVARFWKRRRADVYLGAAVILMVAALFWGGIRSKDAATAVGAASSVAGSPAGGATAASSSVRRKQVPPEPKLSLSEKLLVALGLADPPPAPVYTGNPDTKVWVDLQTALYYCPGSDLYGKTHQGKFTSQRDAQMDQFEPAYRKACD